MNRVRRASRRRVLGLGAAAWLTPCRALVGSEEASIQVGSGTLEAAAGSFDCTPAVGAGAPTYGAEPKVAEIQGPLQTQVFALRQGPLTIGWATSDYSLHAEGRAWLAAGLGIPVGQTVFSVSHNHSSLAAAALRDTGPASFGHRFAADFKRSVAALAHAFEPVTVAYGSEREATISYNRKGRRPDGTTYFMREEDRVRLPADYTGTIDPLASVVRCDGRDGATRLVLAHFTGHPVISYNLERPVINPDYCGWAVADLAASFGARRPVAAFLQGCAGDVNAKGMFSGPELARRSGSTLGAAFARASRRAMRIERPVLALARGVARVPYADLPSLEELERDRRELVDFVRRVEAGDPDTLRVLGYNFSETMTVAYRKNLALPFLRWTDWAIGMRKQGRARPEEEIALGVQAIAIGEVAIVTIPCEAFVGIGLSIRERSPFRLTVPAAYSNGIYPNYIGTSRDVGDREYMSAFYRYIQKPPYRAPAGDVIADVAVELLERLARAV